MFMVLDRFGYVLMFASILLFGLINATQRRETQQGTKTTRSEQWMIRSDKREKIRKVSQDEILSLSEPRLLPFVPLDPTTSVQLLECDVYVTAYFKQVIVNGISVYKVFCSRF